MPIPQVDGPAFTAAELTFSASARR